MQHRSTRTALVGLAITFFLIAALGGLDLAALAPTAHLDPETGHPTVPLASSWGLLALLLLIIAGGFYMARRTPQG